MLYLKSGQNTGGRSTLSRYPETVIDRKRRGNTGCDNIINRSYNLSIGNFRSTPEKNKKRVRIKKFRGLFELVRDSINLNAFMLSQLGHKDISMFLYTLYKL